jgi:hypothetical protein
MDGDLQQINRKSLRLIEKLGEGKFGMVSLVWQVWHGRFGMLGLAW